MELSRRALLTRLPATSLALWLTGCALAPAPQPAQLRAQVFPDLADRAGWAAPATTGAATDGWLSSFDSAELQQVVHEAMERNRDLQLAAVRLEQAQDLAAVQQAGQYPQLAARGRGGKSETRVWSIGASWELDLWGRVRAQARAADAQQAAVQADLFWARRSIAAGAANAWFTLVQMRRQEAQLRDTVALQETLLALARHRVAIGASPASDLQAIDSTLQMQRDAHAQAVLARDQAAQALELLLGRYPDATMAAPDALPALPPAPPAGLPATLVERRPDLQAAAHRVAAAFDLSQAAQAARLPSVSIEAAITGVRSDLYVLNRANSPIKGISAGFLAPLFDAGRLKAQADYQQGEQQAALLTYGNSALKALQEVESGLRAEASYAARAQILQARLVNQRGLLERSEARTRIGSADPRQVLQARQTLLATEIELTQLQATQLRQRVALLLALGGDWDTAAAQGSEAGSAGGQPPGRAGAVSAANSRLAPG